MSKTATIILNRNLPEPTNKLCEHLNHYDSIDNDVYVVEAGSDQDKISKFCTWYVNDNEVNKIGLRYARGMNYGLCQLMSEKKWDKYDYFFLLSNDTELPKKETIKTLSSILDDHPRVGIISPCSKRWGEKLLLAKQKTKYFWFIHNNAYFIRKDFIDTVREYNDPNHMNFLFDGTNFRGYHLESELIAKAYANDWAAAITSEVFAEENEAYLLNKNSLIKTDNYNENLKLYINEGNEWLKRKYGFNSKWTMNQYVKNFYDNFFYCNPEYKKYKL